MKCRRMGYLQTEGNKQPLYSIAEVKDSKGNDLV
jgi:hypothetical protein